MEIFFFGLQKPAGAKNIPNPHATQLIVGGAWRHTASRKALRRAPHPALILYSKFFFWRRYQFFPAFLFISFRRAGHVSWRYMKRIRSHIRLLPCFRSHSPSPLLVTSMTKAGGCGRCRRSRPWPWSRQRAFPGPGKYNKARRSMTGEGDNKGNMDVPYWCTAA